MAERQRPRASRSKRASGVAAGPVRTCVGCRTREPQAVLLRVALVEGTVTADPRRRLPGRGAYVHPRPGCIDQAGRGGLARAFRTRVGADAVGALRAVAETAAGDRADRKPSSARGADEYRS